jgi:hypothetical protein
LGAGLTRREGRLTRRRCAPDFERLELPEIVPFTALLNVRSRRVHGAHRTCDDAREDFEHPALPEGHRYGRIACIAYARHEWETRAGAP